MSVFIISLCLFIFVHIRVKTIVESQWVCMVYDFCRILYCTVQYGTSLLYSMVLPYCTVSCDCYFVQYWMRSVVRLFTTTVLVLLFQCHVTQLYCVALHWYNASATAWYYCSPHYRTTGSECVPVPCNTVVLCSIALVQCFIHSMVLLYSSLLL